MLAVPNLYGYFGLVIPLSTETLILGYAPTIVRLNCQSRGLKPDQPAAAG